MSRRKGELSGSAIDRGWPYQVALRVDDCRGTQYRTVHAFCRDLSLCKRGHSVFHGDEWWEVFCFAEEAHAEAFRLRFGGERCDPRARGRQSARGGKGDVELSRTGRVDQLALAAFVNARDIMAAFVAIWPGHVLGSVASFSNQWRWL